MYKFHKNKFEKCKDVTWDDVIEKLAYEFSIGTHRFLAESSKTPPTFAMHSDKFPGTLLTAYEELKSRANINHMQVYMSLGANSSTFGRHKDTDNVLIVQAIGKIKYIFDDKKVITLKPGDCLSIRKGVYHTPMVSGPRVTLSASLWNYNQPIGT